MGASESFRSWSRPRAPSSDRPSTTEGRSRRLERNGDIVPRATWAEVRLEEGDKLEVVQFVGGGR